MPPLFSREPPASATSALAGGSRLNGERSSCRIRERESLVSRGRFFHPNRRQANMPSYNFKDIELRWQRYWEENKTFQTPDVSDRPKFYLLDMFPYPSGAGLHVGHPEGYTATDILARYRRMCGYNVLHPMGWDAFGLPAEQYAIQTGTHPRTTTEQNINTFRRQIKMLGFSYDWDR